jgi:hypothetical protein
MDTMPETPAPTGVDGTPTPATTRRIPRSPFVNLVGSVMAISGFLLPWFNYQRYGEWYFARGPIIVVNGVVDALAPFQKGDHVTAEAFAAFTLVLLPLVFALFSLASGIVALRGHVPLSLLCLSLAGAISGLFISSVLLSVAFPLPQSAFPDLLGAYYTNDRGLGIPLMFAGFLVLVVGNVFVSRMTLLSQEHVAARSKFGVILPVIFSLLGGVLIVGFFLPLYFMESSNAPGGFGTVPTIDGFVTVPTYTNTCGSSPCSFSAISGWSQMMNALHPGNTFSQGNAVFNTGSLIALLLPVIIGVLVVVIGILHIVLGPRLILAVLYALAIISTIDGHLGYVIYQIYDFYEVYSFSILPFEYGWGTVFIAQGDLAVLTGGVALALMYLRARNQQENTR